MHNSKNHFASNMLDAGALNGIHDYLSQHVTVPMSFDDLLRSKIVYAVSAFDKLIHDLITVGMVQIYVGMRAPTPKYLAESISLLTAQKLAAATPPPPEVVFEEAIRSKLKLLSFQDPDRVADGLSYIWNENHKWQRIAAGIGLSEQTTRTTLRLIVTRRNAIVHEADSDPISGSKLPITRTESDNVVSFLTDVGHRICDLVT